ncbi:MAG TPA: TadE/TadG family type IV pilus assembly protein [Candidatus Dormibacteraeota bacterium]|nr:TadE/TadG family type IV pilus assembly protein [Candidatus Dormibacteraeota bacterium]
MIRRGSGQAVVEFALVAPIFFALVVGVVAAGYLFFQASAVADAAQGAAREAIVQTSVDNGTPPCESGQDKDGDTVTIESAAQKAANILTVDQNTLCQQGSSTTADTFCPGGPADTLVQTAVTGDAQIKVCVGGSLSEPTQFSVEVTLIAHPLEPLLGTSIRLDSTSILDAQPST